MIAIPALDIRDGVCVQLVGGSYGDEPVRLPDALAVAERWADLGFRHLHLVDLDAATLRGSNAHLVRAILHRASAGGTDCELQVGGGVATTDRVAELVHDGAARVIVGTRAIEDPAWLVELATRFPDQLIVAADVRDRQVVTRGWARTLALDITEAIDALRTLPLAGLLVTAVHREGRLTGPDLPLTDLVVARTALRVFAAGGIATLTDLRALAECGVHAAVIGMALYTGALDASALVTEFSA